MLSPTVDDIAQEYEGRVAVGKCNVDDNEEIAERFGVRSIPTLLFFKGGQLVDKSVGLVSKQDIETILNNLL
jgi:thioredoxin 1